MAAAGALEQDEVQEALDAAAERNGVVADDGQRSCWAIIRSGPGAGLQQNRENTSASLGTCAGVRRRSLVDG